MEYAINGHVRNPNNGSRKRSRQPVRVLKIQSILKDDWEGNRVITPELRLSGQWLTEFGFLPESKVQVNLRKNQIIIRLAAENA